MKCDTHTCDEQAVVLVKHPSATPAWNWESPKCAKHAEELTALAHCGTFVVVPLLDDPHDDHGLCAKVEPLGDIQLEDARCSADNASNR